MGVLMKKEGKKKEKAVVGDREHSSVIKTPSFEIMAIFL